MDINMPFLSARMRATIAEQLNYISCERGCIDNNPGKDTGLTITDWEAVIRFLEKFGGGNPTNEVLMRLNENASAISVPDVPGKVYR